MAATAVSAEPHDINGKIENCKIKTGIRQIDTVQGIGIDVSDLFTVDADGMVMPSGIGIETGFGFRIVDLLGKAELDKGLKDPIDSSAGNAADTVLNCGINLVGGRVVRAGREVFQNRPSLYR